MRYLVRQQLLSIADRYWIEDEDGRTVYRVRGRLFSIGDKLSLEDARGREVAFIRQRIFSLWVAYEISTQGVLRAVVKRHLFTLFRCRFTVDVPGPDDYTAQGGFLDHDYAFRRGGRTVARVHLKWVAVRDTYVVDIDDGEDDVLLLASAIVIDQVCHDAKGRQ